MFRISFRLKWASQCNHALTATSIHLLIFEKWFRLIFGTLCNIGTNISTEMWVDLLVPVSFCPRSLLAHPYDSCVVAQLQICLCAWHEDIVPFCCSQAGFFNLRDSCRRRQIKVIVEWRQLYDHARRASLKLFYGNNKKQRWLDIVCGSAPQVLGFKACF